VAGFVYLWLSVDLPDDNPLPLAAAVVTSDGEEIATVGADGTRIEVDLEEIAPIAIEAVVAAEDHRFYDHDGLDPIGMGRALWQNLRTSGTQGGSTITQQLVKVLFTDGDRSFSRKAREAVLALKLERTVDKDDIIERYLNIVYFGRGAYGIEAAAQAYFGIPAAELQAAQAALLAGLIRSPETADPIEDPTEATRRRETVLDALEATGGLTRQEADAAASEPLGALDEATMPSQAAIAAHFVDRVRAEAITAVGEEAIFGGGLRIVTTLDLEAQQAAEAAIAEALTEPDDPQAALVALDRDGAIRAYVGGRDHDLLEVDLASGGSGRQPGSTFKPFVLAAALDAGITLEDRYRAPASIEVEVGGAPWEVENYGGESYGTLDVADATADSVNTVYAQLLAEVGPQAVVDVARAAGVDAELEANPAIALGAEEVAPLQLATGYATFANDGNRTAPYAIARIETAEGDVVWEPERAAPVRAIDEGISRTVTAALRGVIEDGTGTGAAIDRPAAGKTGTTQENVDAWFAGFVPGFTTVVWMGYAEGAVPMADVHGRSVTGGSFPATIWQRFMHAALDGREVEDFPEPPEDLDRQRTPPPRAVPAPVDDPEAEPDADETTTTVGADTTTTVSTIPTDGTSTTEPPATTVPGDDPPPDESPPATEAAPVAEAPAPP
jgi:penicillin-binding protein 1A